MFCLYTYTSSFTAVSMHSLSKVHMTVWKSLVSFSNTTFKGALLSVESVLRGSIYMVQ